MQLKFLGDEKVNDLRLFFHVGGYKLGPFRTFPERSVSELCELPMDWRRLVEKALFGSFWRLSQYSQWFFILFPFQADLSIAIGVARRSLFEPFHGIQTCLSMSHLNFAQRLTIAVPWTTKAFAQLALVGCRGPQKRKTEKGVGLGHICSWCQLLCFCVFFYINLVFFMEFNS